MRLALEKQSPRLRKLLASIERSERDERLDEAHEQRLGAIVITLLPGARRPHAGQDRRRERPPTQLALDHRQREDVDPLAHDLGRPLERGVLEVDIWPRRREHGEQRRHLGLGALVVVAVHPQKERGRAGGQRASEIGVQARERRVRIGSQPMGVAIAAR